MGSCVSSWFHVLVGGERGGCRDRQTAASLHPCLGEGRDRGVETCSCFHVLGIFYPRYGHGTGYPVLSRNSRGIPCIVGYPQICACNCQVEEEVSVCGCEFDYALYITDSEKYTNDREMFQMLLYPEKKKPIWCSTVIGRSMKNCNRRHSPSSDFDPF